jgi:hypothetical protein
MSAPANVERLKNLDAQFTWREREHDLVVRCPKCGAKLVIDEAQKFFIHFGPVAPPRCKVESWPFDDICVALGRVKA